MKPTAMQSGDFNNERMNKYCLSGILLLGLLSFFTGCTDKSDIFFKDPADRLIQNYILQNGLIDVQKTASGLYYRHIVDGSGTFPADSAYVLVEYSVRTLNGDGSDGSYQDATDVGIIQDNNLFSLFKFGGPGLFRIGGTTYDPGFTEGLKMMREGDSMQFFMNSTLSNTSGSKAKEFFVKLVRILDDISEVDQQMVLASLDTITGDYSSVLVRDDNQSIREYMYMSHLQQGVGSFVTLGDTIDVKYTGRFLDGRVFDKSDSTRFVISSTPTVLGFMEACRHLKTGGKATFIMPSVLGYGKTGKREYSSNYKIYQYIVPPFSPLVFDVEILGIE